MIRRPPISTLSSSSAASDVYKRQEYVTVPEQYGIEHLPEGLEMATAGALGLAGSAAVGTLDAAGTISGKTVFVSGATGGVGSLLTQLANHAGATVVATAH